MAVWEGQIKVRNFGEAHLQTQHVFQFVYDFIFVLGICDCCSCSNRYSRSKIVRIDDLRSPRAHPFWNRVIVARVLSMNVIYARLVEWTVNVRYLLCRWLEGVFVVPSDVGVVRKIDVLFVLCDTTAGIDRKRAQNGVEGMCFDSCTVVIYFI
jgi:hypothetical protein